MKFLVLLFIYLICQLITSSQIQLSTETQNDELLREQQHTSATNSRLLQPRIEAIIINNTYLYPQSLAVSSKGCFGKEPLKISQGQQLLIRGNSPFIVYFSTKTPYRYNTFEEYFGQIQQNVSLSYMIESSKSDKQHSVVIPLNIKCSSSSSSFLRMKGIIHIDFLETMHQTKQEFNFILMCASEQELQDFSKIYKPGYIFFCVYFNLVLQVYHGYNRNRIHSILFLLYLMGSMLITEQIVGYVFALAHFILVVLVQKKESNINNKTFVLYNVFWFLNVLLIAFTYFTADTGYQWNSLQIVIQNIVKLHITMFLILRLIKLPRLRYVFWYFVCVAIFAGVYSGNNNIAFQLSFRNPLDLSCFKVDLFFPLMMLPIINYFSSITSWMHRIIGLVVAMVSFTSLQFAIKFMAFTFVAILFYQIKVKNMRVIRHRY